MTPELLDAACDTISELCHDLLMVSGNAMKRHGPDPHDKAILAAAFGMAINRINKIDPKFKSTIHEMTSQ